METTKNSLRNILVKFLEGLKMLFSEFGDLILLSFPFKNEIIKQN